MISSGALRYFLLFILFAGPIYTVHGQHELVKFIRSWPAMGTTFRLTFYAKSKAEADSASQKAFARIEELNMVFSDYNEQSEANHLCRNAGKKVKVSDDLWKLLKLSKKISRQSEGAFDITVGPLTKLWRHSIRQQHFPDSSQISEAKALVNYRWIKFYSGNKVKLKHKGMRLDFGAIAKGYAVDQAYLELQKLGISRALVDGGGDIYVGDPPPNGMQWNIQNLHSRPISVPSQNGLASSGDSYQNLAWNRDRYSHIIDPGKGIGLKNSSPVTVLASSATIADALASTVSVLDAKNGKKLLKKHHARLLEASHND